MKKWDYRVISISFKKGENTDLFLSDLLKRYGEDGWELVSVSWDTKLEVKLILKK